MKITYQDLKRTFPEEKKSVESLYGKIIPVRELSYIVTIPFLRMGITAFQASIISIICALSANVFLSLPFSYARVIGVILVPVWHLLDCVDGNIARYNQTASEYGEVVDAVSGYYMFAFFPLALGVASYNISENYFGLPAWVFLLLGGIASVSDILMRLIHQKYVYASQKIESITGKHIDKGDNQYTLKGFQKFRKMADVELGMVGLPMFALWLSPLFNLYHILTMYYCILFVLSLIVMTYYYLKKCHEVDR